MMNTTQNGTTVRDSLGTGIQGVIEYFTEDGYVGVRDAGGRLDELPEDRAVVVTD